MASATQKKSTQSKKSSGNAKNSGSRSTGSRSSSSKSTGKSSGTKSKASQTESTRRRRYVEEEVYDEEAVESVNIFAYVLMLILAIVFICNFGILGPVGAFVKKITFGLFGFVSYILPPVIAVMYLFYHYNRGNPIMIRRNLAGFFLILSVMICSHMATGIDTTISFDVRQTWEMCSEEFKGGGVIGGFMAYHLVRLLSSTGCILLMVVIILICLITIAGKSLIEGLRETGKLMYEDSVEEVHSRSLDRAEKNRYKREQAKARIERKKEINEQRELDKRLKAEAKENEAILRMDNVSRGVTFNTTLDSGAESENAREEVRDDEHIIKVTDSDLYERRKNNSAVLHESVVSDGSDAIREITPVYDDDDDDRYEYGDESGADTVSDHYAEDEYETEPAYEPEPEPEPVRQAPEPKAPMRSYSAEEGNSMKTATERPRPKAAVSEPVKDKPRKPSNRSAYKFPPVSLLTPGKAPNKSGGDRELKDTADLLVRTLETFGVRAKIIDVSRGPAVTRYELQPEMGVKVSKIVGLTDDLKLALAATDIRIEAPIPGKSAVGIEVPNKENEAVAFRELIESKTFKNSTASLPFAVGKDIGGQIIVHDIAKMPHVLIAGATGSGKSVCINTIVMSILYKCAPEDVRLIMIDPKVVELSVYNAIPHLLLPVVTDPKKAAGALAWGVREMDDRYRKFADAQVRDLKGYNEKAVAAGEEKLPHILIIVDELADLMMVSPGEVEDSICRLAQLARACGIHLVIATQRPSVDVITGLIKANMPSRIAFAVSSGVDSRTILDMVGAEKLLGKGDMLFAPTGIPKPMRVQGAFVPDSDVSKVVDFFKELDYVPGGSADVEQQVGEIAKNGAQGGLGKNGSGGGAESEYDELFAEAGRFIIDKDKASIGALQRLLKIGFNRAARIMDQLAEAGVVGEEQGTKPREILMDQTGFEALLDSLGI